MKASKLISVLFNVVLLNTCLLNQFVNAKNNESQYISLESHVHGLSEITMVIEDGQLNIQLTSPMVNLTGFEHVASSKKEIEIVNNTKALLGNVALLFSLSGGDCSLVNMEIDVSGLTKHGAHSESEVSHESHHSQVIANYRYHCEEKSRLSAIDVQIFDLFSGVNKIHAVWITDSKQGAVTLNAESSEIRL